jgi:ATP-dependent RNA helicase RhlE
MTRTHVFTRTKRGADKVARHLEAAGIMVAAIHGNKSQRQRESTLADFKAGRIRGLIATDIAARGIDIDEVSHVINYELPNIRGLRASHGRAGAEGIAISLCGAEERAFLRDIERLTRQTIPSSNRCGDPGLAAERMARAPGSNGHREHNNGGHTHAGRNHADARRPSAHYRQQRPGEGRGGNGGGRPRHNGAAAGR